MRKWAYDTVKSCPGLESFAGERLFSSGSVDGPEADSPDRPFAVIRFGPKQPGMGRVKQQTFQVWLHVDPASMIPIDKLAEELETWVPSRTPQQHGDDWIMECVWQFTSDDTFDDHYKTTARYVTFMATFRPGAS